MIKLCLALLCIVNLIACSSHQVIERPYAMTQPESMMQKGLQVYQQDDYLQAHQFFTQALVLYQSIDDEVGQKQAKFNLIKANLAIHRFKQVDTVLNSVEETNNAEWSLLKANVLFAKGQYKQAFQAIASDLLDVKTQVLITSKQRNQLFIQTKFALFADAKESSVFYQRLKQEQPVFTIAQQALFKRLDAHYHRQQGQPEQALELMSMALTLYKSQANRRAIANCLEELATLYQLQHQPNKAKSLLKRAFIIRKWLKDDYKMAALQLKLKALQD